MLMYLMSDADVNVNDGSPQGQNIEYPFNIYECKMIQCGLNHKEVQSVLEYIVRPMIRYLSYHINLEYSLHALLIVRDIMCVLWYGMNDSALTHRS